MCFAIALALATMPGLIAFASEEKIAFEEGDVKTELTQMGFNLDEYPKKADGEVALFAFMEYGFHELFNYTDDYGLYFYFYNPQELTFDFTTSKNLVQIGTSYDDKGACIDYDKYQLEFVSSVENGRFLKLKINDLLVSEIHDAKKPQERRYDISGIELIEKGKLNAEEYSVATTFYYTGFAKGFAEDVEAESTLSCRTVELETIELDVKHTTYKAWNTDNVSGQEMATVYFNVPERYFNEYGNLQQIKAEWLYSVTDYIYCTLYKDLFDKYLPYVGAEVLENEDMLYWLCSNVDTSYDGTTASYSNVYNQVFDGFLESGQHISSRFNKINWLMYDEASSLNELHIESEELLAYYKAHKDERNLLSYVDDVKTVTTIDAGTTYDLKGLDKNASGWEWLWESLGFTNTIQSICPIYVLTDSDVNLNNSDFASKLYVNENDVDDIKAKHWESGTRTVLFRFAINDFSTENLIVYAHDIDDAPSDFVAGQKNKYIYRTKLPLYQSFDIIHLGFQKNGKLTIIPAVSNPITVIGSTDAPLDNSNKDWSGAAFLESIFGEDGKEGCEEAKRTLLLAITALVGLVILYFIVRFIMWLKPQRVKVKVKQPKVKKNKSVKPPKI